MSIRSTAKAIIIKDKKVLLNRCYDKNNGEYYSLPGGGQNSYETLEEAVIRECLEETGYTVIPLRFAALCETICDDEEIRNNHPEYAHKMYHIFICNLTNEKAQSPNEKDTMQIESLWVDISELPGIRLLPKTIGDNIVKIINSGHPLFFGSEHIRFNHG